MIFSPTFHALYILADSFKAQSHNPFIKSDFLNVTCYFMRIEKYF